MKEKVTYERLPEGAKYRKAELTESGEFAISYMETSDCKHEATQATKAASEVTTPTPLIGGTDVYHKENGTNYWYCKIKDGRDEFMFLSFGDITKSDLLYDANGKKRAFSTDGQRKFRENALKAIENKPAEGFRWIPVYEPSMGKNGEIQFVSGKDVLRWLDSYKWEKRLREYSPENESQEAPKTTYFLLLVKWLKDGHATLEQIADNSEGIGYFWGSNSKNAKHGFQKTGEREFGGLCGFAGNTLKEVKDPESGFGFSVLGGCCNTYGYKSPLASVYYKDNPNRAMDISIGFLELKK